MPTHTPLRSDTLYARLGATPEQIAAFCQRHHIRRLALFGSVLRDDFRQDSDIDVLVEFEPGWSLSYAKLVGVQAALRAPLCCPVAGLTISTPSPSAAKHDL